MANKGIITFGSDTVEVAIGFVVVAMRSAAIDISIKEFKALMNRHKAMEIFCVQIENIQSIGGLVAARASAVKMFLPPVQTQLVRAGIVLFKLFKPIDHRRVFTRGIQYFRLCQFHFRNNRYSISGILGWSTSFTRCILCRLWRRLVRFSG